MVVKSIAQFFYLLMFGENSFSASPEQFLRFLFNYPIYLFNSWSASNENWLSYDAWFDAKFNFTINWSVMLCYALAFFVLLGIVLGIFNLIKKCLSLGRL